MNPGMSIRSYLRPLDALLVLTVACTAWQIPGVLAQDREHVITVDTLEYSFRPADLRFRHGVPYRLHLENIGKEMHEFTAPEFFKAVDVENPEVLVAAGNEVLLQPGDRKDVRFIPRIPGRYHLTCADHDWAGMIGEIVIE